MRRRLLALASGAAALIALALPAGAAAEPALLPGFQDEVVFGGLEQPTNFRFAPDGRVFVAEKPGQIKVFDGIGATKSTVFADLRTEVYDNGDRGLLGLVLDPDFENHPYVYALYTWDHVLGEEWDDEDPEPAYGDPETSGDPDCSAQNNTNSCLVSGRLVRLEEDSENLGEAVKNGSGLPREEELLQGWCQQFSSHSVGELQFGPEDALYVSGGDGAAYESIADYGQLPRSGGSGPNPCGDPPTAKGESPEEEDESANPASQGGALRSQNLELLNGAILRINPDTGEAMPDNPLFGDGDPNTERTVAKGFRNPFRFTFDSETGEIYSGNVGSSEIEEIDRLAAPPVSLYNSGWPCYEGIERQFQFKVLGLNVCNALYKAENEEKPENTEPFFSYSHGQSVVPDDECPTESGSAVSGLSFYNGEQFPDEYEGAFFFGDAVRGCVWVMLEGENGKPDPSTTKRFFREGNVYAGVKLSEGPGEYLYYASLLSDEGKGPGEIHRIAYRPNSPIARVEAEPPYGPYDESDEFDTVLDASKSTDPDGKPLTYEWDLDEDGDFEIAGSDETQELTFTEAEQLARESEDKSPNRVVTLRVEDDEELSSVARITIYPGDSPPVVTISDPKPENWSVGDEVKLDGKGVNADGEIKSPRPYYWETRLAHCPNSASACHAHPMQTFSGIRRPEFVAPQHDYPSYIEVLLRVSDERGLSGVATYEYEPNTVDLTLASDPPGIELLAASTEATSPFSLPAIDGSEIQLSAPNTAVIDGSTYTFSSWSDGGARAHPIVVGGGQAVYTASYTTPATTLPLPANPIGPKPPPPPLPQTKLRKHPAKKTRSRVAKFTFGATLAGAKFRCKLDGKRKRGCRSPQTYRKLKPGRHLFRVWAVVGGRVDPTPARFRWKVLKPRNRRQAGHRPAA